MYNNNKYIINITNQYLVTLIKIKTNSVNIGDDDEIVYDLLY